MVQELKAVKHPIMQRLEVYVRGTLRYVYGPKEDQDVLVVNQEIEWRISYTIPRLIH